MHHPSPPRRTPAPGRCPFCPPLRVPSRAGMMRPWRRGARLGRRLQARLTTAALRIRRRWRSAVFRAARLTGAAVAAYLVAEALGLVNPPPLVAALTALLVVQATATSTLFSGVERVLAVLAGVAIATGFAFVVGLTWWSLGVLVAAAIVVGQLLRLGPQPHRGADQRDAGARRRVHRRRGGGRAEPARRDADRRGGRGAGQRGCSRPRCAAATPDRPCSGSPRRSPPCWRRPRRAWARLPACPRPARSPTRATSSPPAPAGSRSRRSTARPVTSA